MNTIKYLKCKCFHCQIDLNQRKDTYVRQQTKYGHNCCKHCFGKEPSFQEKRRKIMLEDNPFKDKKHTSETLKLLSQLKIGNVSWNKGLTKATCDSIRISAERASKDMIGKYKGDKNPNWKGGISKTRLYSAIKPHLKEWLMFRKTILQRDYYKCWYCQSSNRLEVHHLQSRRLHPDLEYDESNCILLCNTCHKHFHKRYGRKNFTQRDFINWVNESRTSEDRLVMC